MPTAEELMVAMVVMVVATLLQRGLIEDVIFCLFTNIFGVYNGRPFWFSIECTLCRILYHTYRAMYTILACLKNANWWWFLTASAFELNEPNINTLNTHLSRRALTHVQYRNIFVFSSTGRGFIELFPQRKPIHHSCGKNEILERYPQWWATQTGKNKFRDEHIGTKGAFRAILPKTTKRTEIITTEQQPNNWLTNKMKDEIQTELAIDRRCISSNCKNIQQ